MSRDYHTWSFDLPATSIHYAIYAFLSIDPLAPAEKTYSELGRYQWKWLAWLLAWFYFRFRNYASVAVMKVDSNGNIWIGTLYGGFAEFDQSVLDASVAWLAEGEGA